MFSATFPVPLCCQYLSRVLVPRFCFLLYNLLYSHTFTIRSNLTSHENDHIHFLFVQHWLFLHLFSSSLLPSWKPYICRSCDNFVSTFWYTQHKQRLEDGTLKTPAIALKYEKDKISKLKSPSKKLELALCHHMPGRSGCRYHQFRCRSQLPNDIG